MADANPDDVAAGLAADALAAGDPTGWFERLYGAAAAGQTQVPWDRGGPFPLVAEWLDGQRGAGRRAVVVGCGPGEDAEHAASRGFDVTAFDVAPAAIELARRRHPSSPVGYRVADLFALPAQWRRAFDVVVESLTVQSLPESVRPAAINAVTELVAPGGTALVVAAGRSSESPVSGPPWPLTRDDIDLFARQLQAVHVERLPDPQARSEFRWRAEFTRAAASLPAVPVPAN
jgi:SAM-dependent methyltransferase